MANPRKFSEKIALQKQKQAEGTAEFEKIMKEVYATKRDEPLSTSQQRISEGCLSPEQRGGIPIPGSGGGGSVPGGGGNAGSVGGIGNGGSGSPTAYRESRGRSVGVGPMRRPSDRKVDRSPYSSNVAYLSPPIDSNWRRSNSDSAIHQSLNMQPEIPLYGGQQEHYMQHQNHQQHPYHPHQRSHSPAASVGLSPTAQRRKTQNMVSQSHSSSNLQQLQLQDHLHHHKLNNHLHMHPHQQNSMTKSQLQFNPSAPTHSVFKTLQEQAMMANTGSLPDLTSVHFSNAPSPSPTANSHNAQSEREQSQSPFNNQPYQQQQQQQHQQQQQQQQQQLQQHSSGDGGLRGRQTHLSFTNLPVMVNPSSNNISANCSPLHNSYGHLPSIGGISASPSSNTNLTEYRNPQHNPPSPAGSTSPGLMVSTSPHDLHISAPNSPIRHHQQPQQQQYSDKNIQTYDRFSPNGDYTNSSNNLNSSFHNHFEQFTLGDSVQSESQYIPTSLQQDVSPHNSYSQSLQFNDVLFGHHQQFNTENGNSGSGRCNDLASLTSKLTGVSGSVTATSGGDPYMSMSNRNTLNNCSGGGSSTGSGGSNNNNSSSGSTTATGTASASCSPLHSPRSPNPHNPSNNNSNIVNDIAAIAQKSHQTNDAGGGVSGGAGGSNISTSNIHNSTPTPTTPNIPSIVFSDFSSNSDFSKEMFDTLDLDLGPMDVSSLQMLSDPSTIMIADQNIEDSFRRDLN